MKDFLKNYFRFRKYLKGNLLKYWISIFLGFALILVYNLSIFQMRGVINDLSAGKNLIISILLIAGILSMPLVLEPMLFSLRRRIFGNLIKKMYIEVYNHVMKLDYKYHTDKETGILVSKILRIQEIVMMFLWHFEWALIVDVGSFIVPIILLSIISWKVGLVVFVVMVALLPFEVWAMKTNLKYRNRSKNEEYKVNSLIVDTLSAYESVRLFGNIGPEKSILNSRIEIFRKAYLNYQDSFTFIDFSARFTGVVMFLSGALVGYRLLSDSQIDSSSFIIIITYLINITNGTLNLVMSIRNIFQSTPMVEDLFNILDEKNEISEPEKPVILDNPIGQIKFDEVSFSYNKCNELPTLDKISFDVQSGQNVALVGPSGGGKSTITKLLLRYYLPNCGNIMIDNININDLGTDNINKLIGVVPQEPVLFNRSLKFNIGYALGSDESVIEKNMDKIIEASKRAMIHEFIVTLPLGYDTVVGERGIKLSGGQKQRVAIARVILKAPKIVIFDEATSMLDSESEAAIQKAFKELARETTTIIIAHRLSTIRNVDKIFVIDKGKLIEQGDHDELVKLGGVYARLWNMQSSGFKRE